MVLLYIFFIFFHTLKLYRNVLSVLSRGHTIDGVCPPPPQLYLAIDTLPRSCYTESGEGSGQPISGIMIWLKQESHSQVLQLPTVSL